MGLLGRPRFVAVAEDSGWPSRSRCRAPVLAFAEREVWDPWGAPRFLGVWRMSAGRSGSAPPVLAAQSRLLEELIGVLIGAFFLSAWSLANFGVSLPDLKTRASGSGAELCLPRGTCDITSDSSASSRDRSRISAKSDSELSGSVSSAPSNPPLFRVHHGVPVLAFAVREVWAVL